MSSSNRPISAALADRPALRLLERPPRPPRRFGAAAPPPALAWRLRFERWASRWLDLR